MGSIAPPNCILSLLNNQQLGGEATLQKDMERVTIKKPEMRTIVLVDAVNFTNELKTHGRGVIAPKINRLQEFAEFFFCVQIEREVDRKAR